MVTRKRTSKAPAFEPYIKVHAAGVPVTVTVPFPQGQVTDLASLSLLDPSSKPIHVDKRAFITWPDASARWVLLSFVPTTSGAYKAILEPHTPPLPVNPVQLAVSSGIYTLSNGLTQIVLTQSGPGPIQSITSNNHTWLSAPQDFALTVNDATSLHADKDHPRKIQILEQGSARTQIRITADHRTPLGESLLAYTLDIELWAGANTLRFDYQFFHKEKGKEFIDIKRIGADFHLNLQSTTRHLFQLYHGEFYEPRDIYNPAPVAIITDDQRFSPSVQDPAMSLDTYKYDSYLDAPLVDAPNWLGVLGEGKSAYIALSEMSQMQPKRVASDGNRLSVDAWPARAGTLKLPQGRSRRITFTLGFFTEEKPDRAKIQPLLNYPLHEGRATVDPEWLSHARVFEQAHVLPFGKSARFEKFLNRLTQLSFTCEFFDLGDTIDTGYRASYTSQGYQRETLRQGVPKTPRAFMQNGVLVPWLPVSDYEPVWVNNEYDGIHAIASELMRTGKPAHWTTLRWMARHNIEVDFWHYHDNYWLNRIPPVHSAKHSTSGGYPSHFWTQGLLEYYCLTADPDALEVSIALGDAILRFFHDPVRGKFYRNFDRENGWALLALVHVYDITREDRFKQEIDRLIEFFMHGQQANTADTMRFESVKTLVFNRDLIGRFYFMLNLVEATDLYQTITGRADIHKWLVEVLRTMPPYIEQNYRMGLSAYSTCAALAIGFERTGDITFLTAGLTRIDELIQDDPRWLNPVPEIKPMAILYREFIRYLGPAYREGLLDKYEYPSLQ
jgi:hypothetical protein